MYKFTEGEVVRHKLYQYRAVVLDIDSCCTATTTWYITKTTQPSRNQPWYLVLDEEGRERYVAEEYLLADHSGKVLSHPVIPLVFPSFAQGKYYRQSLN